MIQVKWPFFSSLNNSIFNFKDLSWCFCLTVDVEGRRVCGGACRVGGDAGVEAAVVHPGGGDVEVADDVAARGEERVEHEARAAAQLGAVQQPRDVRIRRTGRRAPQRHARTGLDRLRDERRVQLRRHGCKQKCTF